MNPLPDPARRHRAVPWRDPAVLARLYKGDRGYPMLAGRAPTTSEGGGERREHRELMLRPAGQL